MTRRIPHSLMFLAELRDAVGLERLHEAAASGAVRIAKLHDSGHLEPVDPMVFLGTNGDAILRDARRPGEAANDAVGATCQLTSDELIGQILTMRPEQPPLVVERAVAEIMMTHAVQEKRKTGRPTVAQWDAIEDLIKLEIERRGYPERENENGWRTQADVEKWVADILSDRGESASVSTIRNHVRDFLDRAQKARTETP